MLLYTIQMAKWRKAKALDIPFLDTTVKSGDLCFAPTWDMVQGVKSGELSEEQYTVLYKQKMLSSIKSNPARWGEILKMESVAVACFCPNGVFCHRYILADILSQLCRHNHVECVREGEIV